jgi:hypothetical protein
MSDSSVPEPCEVGFERPSAEEDCADVDECASDNGGCAQTCTNEAGAYACSCEDGFVLNEAGHTCDDVDECAEDNGGCAQTCTNEEGAYACSCEDGFVLSDDLHICDDVDECAEDNGGCGGEDAWTCVNQLGGEPTCLFDCAIDYTALMDGVNQWTFGSRVWPSALIVHGAAACPLIYNNQTRVVVASARFGQGRILQTGHEHPMNRDLQLENHDGERLMRNAVAWMSGGGEGLRIGRHPQQFSTPVNLLAADGHMISALRPSTEGLAEIDIYFVNSRNNYGDEEIDALRQFVLDGGGLISSGYAWSWGEGNGGQAVTGFPGNRVTLGSGLTVTKANQYSGTVPVSAEPLPDVWHSLYGVYAVDAHVQGVELMSPEDQQIVASVVGFALSTLPLSIDGYYVPVQALIEGTEPIVPTPQNRVSPANAPLEVLLMRIVDKLVSGLPFDRIAAHPAGADFPGQPPVDTPNAVVERTFDATYAGRSGEYNYSNAGRSLRVSTGAYARAGQTIRVTIPEGAAGQGLRVQIGTHSDQLWGVDAIQRFPQIIRGDALRDAITSSTSAFGGPVYILVPGGTEVGEIAVEIEGAVCAAHYIHGETELDEWAEQLETCQAPWVEIETSKVIFAVQRSEALNIPDVAALMTFWDEVMDAMADLEGGPHERVRAERFTLDRQISAGALHSGYPIMGHLRHHDGLLSLEDIRASGSWGPFHELGHNHQWRDWFLPGTTEATCNLWSVYVNEEVLGLPTRIVGRLSAERRAAGRAGYLDAGANFAADWNVWIALDTYLQLQEGFGWEMFSTLFADYRRESDAGQGSAQDRIDEWVMRTSAYADRNLGPFYLAWGFPISDDVLEEIEDYPEWEEDPMR